MFGTLRYSSLSKTTTRDPLVHWMGSLRRILGLMKMPPFAGSISSALLLSEKILIRAGLLLVHVRLQFVKTKNGGKDKFQKSHENTWTKEIYTVLKRVAPIVS